MSEQLIKAVCPNFPGDREVVETSNFERFFKVVNGKLFVPADRFIRGNFILTDKYIEAVNAFAVADLGGHNYDWDNLNTRELRDPEEIKDAIMFLSTIKLLSCDIETKDTSFFGNKLLAIGFAYDECSSFVFPDPTAETLSLLQKYIYSNNDIKIIWQNGKFDTSRLKFMCNIDARVDEDTMLQHYVGINERKGTHGLKELGPLYLQAPQWDDKLEAYKKEWCRHHGVKLADFTYDMIPVDILIPYLHRDCIATYRLNKLFHKIMRPGAKDLYYKLCKASTVYGDIERTGNYVDRVYWQELHEILDEKIADAEREVRKCAKEFWDPIKYQRDTGTKAYTSVFNHKSPAQLKWLLSTITGEKLESTDKKELERLENTYPEIPFIQAISALRKYNKYMDTYVFGIQSVLAPDGRVRCSYNLHGTETGRLSSSEPNMQNIPRDKLIKNLFIAPEGYKLVQFDYSQAELRVLAYLSQDDYLKGVYQRGEDLHDAMALKIFGPNFTKEQRVAAKTINFGIPYGRGAGTIAQQLHIDYASADKMIRDWFRAAPKADAFVKKMRRIPMDKNAEPFTTIFGRQRHYIITSGNAYGVQNEAINFPIQATASDLTMLSTCEIARIIKERSLDARIVNTVHDSIILEVKDDPALVQEVAEIGVNVMAAIPQQYLPGLDFPFRADVETGYKWGELH